ncbi:MAG TPA: hypothetical protein VH280_08345 [Verrucomicrobiae bacterium]|jgi:hypothetical protein|nr:hypothetical protein [Verrucomicrobiae bacterium]
MSDEYPTSDFPWSFYFNGEVMPKWGACWGMAQIANFLQLERDADQELGHRDVYIIYGKIDHVGVVESADPDVFIYAVQEVLHILLSQRDSVFASLSGKSPDIYSGLVATAFRMHELVIQQRCAFWSSGYEEDRVRLVEVMRRCQLPSDSPDFTLSPHMKRWRSVLQSQREWQVRQLHQLAQSGQLEKDLRKRLHEIRAT